MSDEKEVVLKVENLAVSFRTNEGIVKAVRDINYELYKGETLAIVGESGSGKSVSSRTVMGILAGNAIIDSGSVIFKGQDLTKIREDDFHKIRGNQIGMIFQDPTSSLNPIMKIGKQIMESLLVNGHRKKDRFQSLYHDEYQSYINAKFELQNLKSYYYFKDNKKKKLKRYKIENKQIANNLSLGDQEKQMYIEENLAIINSIKNSVPSISTEQRSIAIKELKVKIPELKKVYIQSKKDAKTSLKKEYEQYKIEHLENLDKARKDLEFARKNHQIEKASLREKIEKLDDEKIEKLANSDKNERVQINHEFANAKKQVILDSKKDLTEARHNKNLVMEEYRRKFKVTKKEALEKALSIMEEVGIPEPEKRINMYPFQFSGGMKQRIVIAIALTAAPEVLICDEPTTALDVTIQAQILELIKKIKRERNLSVIFITHNLGVVANVADRVAVMYAGKIVEYGNVDDIFYDPKHPYTWALLSSMPDLNSSDRLLTIPGTPPNMLYPPRGDAFAQRNQYALKIDFEEEPPMFKVSDTHYAATWLLDPRAPKTSAPDIVLNRRNEIRKTINQMIKDSSKDLSEVNNSSSDDVVTKTVDKYSKPITNTKED